MYILSAERISVFRTNRETHSDYYCVRYYRIGHRHFFTNKKKKNLHVENASVRP